MSKKEVENQQAFPELYVNDPNLGLSCAKGMTLRDYFASKAITKAIDYRPAGFKNWIKWFLGKNYNAPEVNASELSASAYKIADEMLKQRIK